MKKTFAILVLIIIFFIVYFLQSNFFSWFTISGIKPNLLVILILMIGLFAGKKLGLAFGIASGLYIDLLLGKSIGVSAILLGAIGFLAEYFDNNFSKQSRITLMIMVIVSTVFYELGAYIYSIFKLGIGIEIYSFIKILFIEAIYNAIIIIILHPIIQKWGYALENTFKVKKILTRYF